MDTKIILVVSSSLLIVVALSLYLRDILKGKTKPRVVSWFNWSLLTFITAFASLSDHQYPAAIMSFSLAFLCASITVVGWHKGDKRFTKLDIFSQFGVLVSLGLWWVYNSAAVAIIAVIVIDFVALIPTLEHAWTKPEEETYQQFLLSGTAALLTIFAAEAIKVTSIANPIYIVFADLSTAYIIISRRKALAR